MNINSIACHDSPLDQSWRYLTLTHAVMRSDLIVSLFPCLSCSLAMKIINGLSSKDMLPQKSPLQLLVYSLSTCILSFFLHFSVFILSQNCSFRATHPLSLWLFTFTESIISKSTVGVVVFLVAVECFSADLWLLLVSEGSRGPSHTRRQTLFSFLELCLHLSKFSSFTNTLTRLVFSQL